MNNFHDLSEVQKFYKNSTVFLSGATGFIGKLVVEKILRALPVKKIYVLIRKKNDISSTERIQTIFESPIFDSIKRDNVFNNVFVMEGECSFPMLGLSEEDQRTFIEETFVYVSTAYSNCPKKIIEEEIYPAKISAENLINICEVLDDECLNSITKTLIGESPNCYTFGKQVIEEYINREARNLPICIIRPAVVVSTVSEPVPGFIDNAFSVAGYVLANSSGLNRIVYHNNVILDVVPADIVVNACIAAGWQIGESFKPDNSEVSVYNISSAMGNPISLVNVLDTIDYYMRQVPSEKLLIMYPLWFKSTNINNYNFCTIIYIWVSHIFDFILLLQGKKRRFARAIAKLNKFKDAYLYFTTHSVYPQINNTRKLLKTMSLKDRKLFSCDVTTVNWEDYFSQYAKGIRVYLLKDPMHTLPDGLKQYSRLRNIFIGSILIIVFLLFLLTNSSF